MLNELVVEERKVVIKNQEYFINSVCSFQYLLQYLQWHNTGTCGSLNAESNAPRFMICDTRLFCDTLCRTEIQLLLIQTPGILIVVLETQFLWVPAAAHEWVHWGQGKELAEGMGVGQSLSMKLKNMHLPHPQPIKWYLARSLGWKGSCISTFAELTIALSLAQSWDSCIL